MKLFWLIVFITAFWSSDILAHARWSSDGATPGRNNRANLKQGPCGGVPRTNRPAVFEVGSTISLSWESTIYHRGYFIISFSPESDKNFENHVLIDNIPERASGGPGVYTAEVTLPNEPCDNCTLQMIQVMLDRNPPTNYYSCADIQLVAKTDPVDTLPPASVTNLTARGGSPSLSLTWQNPADDFAGVIVMRGGQDSPQMGTEYATGDQLDSAEIVFVGRGQAFSLDDAIIDEWFGVFAMDAANNYSDGKFHQVAAASNHPPKLELRIEQIGADDSDVYAADGDVIVQAAVTDADATDSNSITWEAVPSIAYVTNESDQLQFDPSNVPEESITINATVIDDGVPPYSDNESIAINILPYSRYTPSLALYQNGAAVTRVDLDQGEAEIRVVFKGKTPADLSLWQANWQHALISVDEDDLALTFDVGDAGSYEVSAEIMTAYGPASEPLTLSFSAYKPIRLGTATSALLVGLVLLLSVRHIRRRLSHRLVSVH